MGQTKNQKKNADIENERASKKKPEHHNAAKVDLPGIVQRITDKNNPRPADILRLNRTIGNRKTQRLLGKTSVSAVAPDSMIVQHLFCKIGLASFGTC